MCCVVEEGGRREGEGGKGVRVREGGDKGDGRYDGGYR